jgi:hypothetical protein
MINNSKSYRGHICVAFIVIVAIILLHAHHTHGHSVTGYTAGRHAETGNAG